MPVEKLTAPAHKRRGLGGINSFLAVCMVAVGAMSVAAALELVTEAASNYEAAGTAESATNLAAGVMILQEKLVQERIPVTDAMSTEVPATPERLATVARSRGATDAAMANLLAVAAANAPDNTDLHNYLAGLQPEIGRTRAVVDTAIRMAGNQRNTEISPMLVTVTNDAVKHLDLSLDRVAAMLQNQECTLTSLLDLARTAWLIRQDSSLRIQQFIKPLNTHQKLTPGAVERVMAQDMALDKDWAQAKLALDRLVSEPTLQDVAAQVRQIAAKGSTDLHDMMAIGRVGNAYPVTFEAFGPSQVPALVASYTLRDAALAGAAREVSRLYRQANARLAGSAMTLLMTIVISVFVTRMLRGRIVVPLIRMTEVIDRLARGERDVKVPGTQRTDEIGRLARALETLRGNA